MTGSVRDWKGVNAEAVSADPVFTGERGMGGMLSCCAEGLAFVGEGVWRSGWDSAVGAAGANVGSSAASGISDASSRRRLVALLISADSIVVGHNSGAGRAGRTGERKGTMNPPGTGFRN